MGDLHLAALLGAAHTSIHTATSIGGSVYGGHRMEAAILGRASITAARPNIWLPSVGRPTQAYPLSPAMEAVGEAKACPDPVSRTLFHIFVVGFGVLFWDWWGFCGVWDRGHWAVWGPRSATKG